MIRENEDYNSPRQRAGSYEISVHMIAESHAILLAIDAEEPARRRLLGFAIIGSPTLLCTSKFWNMPFSISHHRDKRDSFWFTLHDNHRFNGELAQEMIIKKMEQENNIYLDHASTSWPKPQGVGEAMVHALQTVGNPSRGGHSLSTQGSDIVEKVRTQVASLVGAEYRENIIFTPGATYAINLAIKGIQLGPRDHVVATCFDHNSVLRPLEQIQRERGVGITVVKCPDTNEQLVDAVRASIRPQTRLLIVNHASNVTGAVLPCKELIELAHTRGIIVLLDACQSVGHLPFTLETLPADLIAFGAHKALLGPPGVGCLVICNPEIRLIPDVTGGTGSDSRNMAPETAYPSSLEPGTLNVPAIAGLGAALEFHNRPDQKALVTELDALRSDCLEKLSALPRVCVHSHTEQSIPIISFNIEEIAPERVSANLDNEFHIQTRAGLHCAPLVHDVLKTNRFGSVRVSFGYGNGPDSSKSLLEAICKLAS